MKTSIQSTARCRQWAHKKNKMHVVQNHEKVQFTLVYCGGSFFCVCDCPIHKMLLSPLNYDIIVDIKSNLQNAWKKQTCLCGSLLTCWWWLYWFLYLISLSFGNSGEMDCITMRDWKHGCVASLLETDTSDQCCMCPVVSYLHDFTSALRSAPVNCLYV